MSITGAVRTTSDQRDAPVGEPRSSADFLLLDDDLSPQELALRDRIRRFVDQEVLPIINDYWERAEFPWELVPKLAELGIIGGMIKGYGCPGLTRREAGIVAREMGRGDDSVNTFLGVHSAASPLPIHRFRPLRTRHRGHFRARHRRRRRQGLRHGTPRR